MGPYILDFYCHEHRLGIELDGGQHNEPDARSRDGERTRLLESKGVTVIRFWNNDVLRATDAVLERLYQLLSRTLTPTLSQRERESESGFGRCRCPTATDTPSFDVVHLQTAAPQIPGGYNGCVYAYAAVVNAVADAIEPLRVEITSPRHRCRPPAFRSCCGWPEGHEAGGTPHRCRPCRVRGMGKETPHAHQGACNRVP